VTIEHSSLCGEKILLTGPTSQVGWPLACALVRDNEVYGLARLTDAADRERLQSVGVEPLPLDLGAGSLAGVPDDFTIVLNFAVVKTGDFAVDLAANAEGAGRLLAHCRRAKAFLHCSSAAVYAPQRGRKLAENAPLGDSHAALLPTYSFAKIAAESVVRFAAREFGVPTTIARFSVPYGSNGGWPWYHLMMMRAGTAIPLHPDDPCVYNPIHEDDYIAQVPALLAAAAVPATTVNWGGEPAALEDWCRWIAELTGLEPRFRTTEKSIPGIELDLTRMHDLIGPARVGWRDGVRRMIETRAPELLRQA
jgi:nucleoside-diphosphate-sugar epimerase